MFGINKPTFRVIFYNVSLKEWISTTPLRTEHTNRFNTEFSVHGKLHDRDNKRSSTYIHETPPLVEKGSITRGGGHLQISQKLIEQKPKKNFACGGQKSQSQKDK